MRVPFHLISDVFYKRGRFSKAFSKKELEFVLYKEDNLVIFKPSVMLFPPKADFILKEQSCKKDKFVALASNNLKTVLVLLAEVEEFYVQVFKV